MHFTRYIAYSTYALYFLLAGSTVQAQNLVPNPGFEYHTQCPDTGEHIEYAFPWDVPLNTYPSTEYFNVCGTGPWYSLPDNGGINPNHQWPAAGEGCAGFFLYNQNLPPNYREYLQTPLTAPLVAGQVYHVSLQAVSHDQSKFACGGLAAYFSAAPVTGTGPNNQPLPYTPQLVCPMPIADKDNWIPFHFYYQAAGGEQNLLIGNFFNDTNTPLVVFPGGNFAFSYIFLDEVYVEPAQTWITCPFIHICQGTSATLTAHGNGPFQWATADAPGTLLQTGDSITVTPAQTTTYYAYGAADTGIYTLYVLPTPAPVNLGNDTAYCTDDFVQLIAAQPDVAYLWQDGTTEHTYYPTQSGTYWVQVSIGNCRVSDTVQLAFLVPEAHLPNDTILCQGQTLLLDATWPHARYLWQNGHTGPTYTATQTGQYQVQVSIGSCTVADSIQVTVNPYPTPHLGPDQAVCNNALPLLDATRPGATYLWQNGSTAPVCPVTQPGVYWVNVSLGPCTATDSTTITLMPAPTVNLGPDTLPCTGDTLWLNAAGNNLSYLWQDGTVQATHAATQSGTYAVQVTAGNGCTDADSITVTYINPPHLLFTDSTLCMGEAWLLDIHTPLGSYLWQDKTEDPVYNIQHGGTYWASISNPCGSDSDTLEVEYRRCDCTLYVPNAFTPEGNGLNERFVTLPHPDCQLEEFRLGVYDRWGNLLFSSGNPEFNWDGHAVPQGLYLYLIRYKFQQTPLREVRGHVLVLR